MSCFLNHTFTVKSFADKFHQPILKFHRAHKLQKKIQRYFHPTVELEELLTVGLPALYDKDINDKIDYLFVGAGTHETGFMARHEKLHKELDEMGIKHDYYVGSNGAHDLVAWKHLLYYRFLPNLWKNLK